MLKEKLGLHCCSFAMIWKANRKVQKFLGKSSTTICFLHFFSTATWPGIEKWKQSKISSLHTKVAADRSAQSQTTVFKKLFKHLKMHCLKDPVSFFAQENNFQSLTKSKLRVIGLKQLMTSKHTGLRTTSETVISSQGERILWSYPQH